MRALWERREWRDSAGKNIGDVGTVVLGLEAIISFQEEVGSTAGTPGRNSMKKDLVPAAGIYNRAKTKTKTKMAEFSV